MGQTPGLKVVLDTNVVVSSLLFKGSSQQLVPLWQSGAFEWLASAAIIREYTRALAYPKFQLNDEEVRELLNEDILPFVTAIAVSDAPEVIKEDPSDDQFLACPVCGHADLIVSGDQHLLKLARHQNIPILTLRAFLERLQSTTER